MTEVVTDMAT